VRPSSRAINWGWAKLPNNGFFSSTSALNRSRYRSRSSQKSRPRRNAQSTLSVNAKGLGLDAFPADSSRDPKLGSSKYFVKQSSERVILARERLKPSKKRSKTKSLPFHPGNPFLNGVQSLGSILPSIPFVSLRFGVQSTARNPQGHCFDCRLDGTSGSFRGASDGINTAWPGLHLCGLPLSKYEVVLEQRQHDAALVTFWVLFISAGRTSTRRKRFATLDSPYSGGG